LSRPALPIRLHLEDERRKPDGTLKQSAYWSIRDGAKRISTRCGAADIEGATRALHEYLAKQHQQGELIANQAARDIPVADVIAYYSRHVANEVARPIELLARLGRVMDFFGDMNLGQVNGAKCWEYIRKRGTMAGSRRELDDFKAAIGLYTEHGLLRETVKLSMPPPSKKRMNYFLRKEIAALVRYCYRHRRLQKGKPTRMYPLRHLIPFILTAVYTGTRSTRIWTASYEREKGRPWIDLENGIYYREAQGEIAYPTKTANSVRLPERLVANMRLWQSGSLKSGVRKPTRYLVELNGKPGNPRLALTRAMDHVFGEGHKFVIHTFRHSCATWLIWDPKNDLGDIASYMSMTREMLVKVYGKEHPDADLAVGKSISSGTAGKRGKRLTPPKPIKLPE
jgi:integrase